MFLKIKIGKSDQKSWHIWKFQKILTWIHTYPKWHIKNKNTKMWNAFFIFLSKMSVKDLMWHLQRGKSTYFDLYFALNHRQRFISSCMSLNSKTFRKYLIVWKGKLKIVFMEIGILIKFCHPVARLWIPEKLLIYTGWLKEKKKTLNSFFRSLFKRLIKNHINYYF